MVGVKQLKIALYISANLRDVVIGQNEQQVCLVQVSDDKIYLNRVRIRISFVWKQGQHPQRILTLSTQKNSVITLTYSTFLEFFHSAMCGLISMAPTAPASVSVWSTGLLVYISSVSGLMDPLVEARGSLASRLPQVPCRRDTRQRPRRFRVMPKNTHMYKLHAL